MLTIPLAAIPNQTFNVLLDENEWDFGIYFTGTIMAVDVTLNGVVILTGARAVPDALVLPYQYQENGNFYFDTLNDAYPDYTEFGITQNLIYLSPADLVTIRDSST